MRKWWIIAMVVAGTTVTAQATLYLRVNDQEAPECGEAPWTLEINQPVTISVHSDDDGGYIGWLQLTDPTGGEWVGVPTVLPAAGFDAEVEYYGLIEDWPERELNGDWWTFESKSFNPYGLVVPGKHFDFQMQLTNWQPGDPPICVRLWDGAGETVLDSISFIPEPASIGLLSLGALTLLRRRRS